MNFLIPMFAEWFSAFTSADVEMGVSHRVVLVLLILVVSFALDFLCKRILSPLLKRMTKRTQTKWDDYLLNDDVLSKACHLIPPIAAYVMMTLFFSQEQFLLDITLKIFWIYILIMAIRLIFAIINSVYSISNEHEKYKHRSLKGFYQMLKLLVAGVGIIVIVSELIDKSPIVILTGLGAGTAILMLVFQDSIKGLVAGIQLTANDMLRPGDWITVPKHDADGDVIEVSLTTVKVRNWDKTITTVPPYALVNDSFQNWRGMFDIGGRRIKRSLNIDMNSVRFCTPGEWKQYIEEPWMEGYERTGAEEVNLSLFRHYVMHYLKNHPKVHQEMIILVRQLQPTAQGLPIELYFFSADTAWVNYEALQAEVFDHIIAIVQKFGLTVFQSPSGLDVHALSRN